MKHQLTALRGTLLRPGVQDAGLAAVLLAATWAVYGGAADDHSGLFTEAVWLRSTAVQWVLISVGAAAVVVRRVWPVVALAAAVVAVLVEMALALGPLPIAAAVPVVLYTVAVRRERKVSLAVLGALLALMVAWSLYTALDGKANGWTYAGWPLGAGGREQDPDAVLGPTDWGGIPVLGPLLVVAWAIGWGVRSRREYLVQLRDRQRGLEREREQRAALAVAEERARITRELHDVVAHGLAVIVMQAQGGAAAFAKRPESTLAALDTIAATGRASLADIRQVLAEPEAGAVPGLADLPELIARVQQAGTLVRLRTDGVPRALPAGVNAAAYRIVQEALTNSMKHAGPGAAVTAVIGYGHGEVTVEVVDDGVGGAVAGSGNGLRGMRKRAAMLGGEVEAGPVEGGFAVRARLPFGPEDAA
ncbi:sensor histidine kinase [Glycomyces dulcitolivorans]|uniref:sensor histidine kinase n=1 Tax=Glycomyces dulcitolivorans TaxID=2200759 RepID=UPI000DD30F9A|nr:histidine kinase [Glycomyces dulcitolivorans]